VDSSFDDSLAPQVLDGAFRRDEKAEEQSILHLSCHGRADTVPVLVPIYGEVGAGKSALHLRMLAEALESSRRDPGYALLVLDACGGGQWSSGDNAPADKLDAIGSVNDHEVRGIVRSFYEYLVADESRSPAFALQLAQIRHRSGLVLGRAQRRHKRAHLLLEQLERFDPQVREAAETTWNHGRTGIEDALAPLVDAEAEQQELRRWLADALVLIEEFERIYMQARMLLLEHLRLALEARAARRFDLAPYHIPQPRKLTVRPLAASLTARAPNPPGWRSAVCDLAAA
jgi:hypothetical protein